MTYREYRTVLGFQPNTRTMMVKISPRQKDKIIHFIEFEGWHNTKKQATIKEIAQILGLLQSVAQIFPWALAQCYILQNLLRECINRGYNLAQRNQRLQQLIIDESRKIPSTLLFCLRYLDQKMKCQFLWSSRAKIHINSDVRMAISQIYRYLASDQL